MNGKDSQGEIFDNQVLKRLLSFLSPYKWLFFLLLFLIIFLGVLAPIRPFLIQLTIDDYIIPGDYNGLTMMIAIMIGITVMQAIMQFTHTYLSGWLGQHVIRDIRIKLYKHILSLKLQFFDKTPIGRLVTRTVSDIETLSEVFTNGLAAIISDILQLVFILAFMFYTNWKLALVSLSTFPLMILSTYVFKEKIKVAFKEVRNAVSNLNTFVQERITGMAIVQVFNSEKREKKKFDEINKEHLTANLKTVMYYSIYFPVAEVLGATCTGLLIWYGAKNVLSSDITLGILTQFILYISLFFRPLRMLADRFNTLQLGIVSTDRIMKLLDSREQVQNSGSQSADTLKGEVKFNNVSFAYKKDEYVLKNISFDVKQGETIAFVGATGAGKSSIINLLTRFYEINKGTITIDGIDIREYDLKSLREHIGIVLQDVFLFSDSIRNNITLGNEKVSMDEILKAAELVGAKEFIEKLPEGFDYNVMERGATLSVGQRQLISFVRAMVYDPKIIVLDEATSSVDTETEELIQNAIDKVMKGRTSIVIAHRLATIQKADKIIVLDKGEIKEIGTHDELLRKEGFYAHLHEIQYKSTALSN